MRAKERLDDFPVTVRYSGNTWKIYYYPIDDFERDLLELGRFLEFIEEKGEEVCTVVPNTGFVKTSLVLGTSFQGVKGFAVVVRKGKDENSL